MGKVLDLVSRLKSGNNSEVSIVDSSASVTDITSQRAETLKHDRRQVKRTILTEFIAVHAIVPGMGLMKVTLFDITQKGLSFDLEEARGSFNPGEAVAMRVYLNYQTYFPFEAVVRHVSTIKDEGVVRHGCEFVVGSVNDIALQHFVAFIENVSASLRHDKGDTMVTKINS